ncbi:MAG: hypothetical protein C4519_00330 [Desulfobacteraceae bacterium]|nr:MAG: hypothetical protein C4519_00330 [Desulfobacteraceae bacterium]
MARTWKAKWKLPGARGMVSSSDPLDVPPEAGLLVENADFSRKLGALCKRPGFDLHALAAGLPPEAGVILSLAYLPYVKVWDDLGTTKINQHTGRLIVQVNGEHGLDYYYREINLDTGAIGAWSLLQSSLDCGTTRADRIRWVLEPGVLRGVCGNWEDSYPVWMGYIDRAIADHNGYFHDFTYRGATVPADLRGYHDIFTSRVLPEAEAGMKFIGKYLFGSAGYKNMGLRYLLVPVFDGHQVATPNEIELINSEWSTNITVDLGCNDVHRFVHLQIATIWSQNPRLTGFNVYESHSLETRQNVSTLIDPYDDWKLARQIDLRIGNPNPVYQEWGRSEIYPGQDSHMNIQYTDYLENDCFNDLWIEIIVSETHSEFYRVTDTTSEDPSEYTYIHFTPDLNTQIQHLRDYSIRLYERWKQVGAGNFFSIDLLMDGTGLSEQVAPEWLPLPNQVNDPTYKYPKIGANYQHAIFFEEMLVAGNVFFDGVKKPLDVMISLPINSDFAGHDLFPDTINLEPMADDEIMGFAQSLNILGIFTKYRIFRYTFDDSGPRLLESPFKIGLVAPDSLVTINGWHWFLGRHGPERSVYRWDGIHPPEDMGAQIGDELKEMLAEDGVIPEHAIGWFDKRTQQYRLALNAYQYAS